MTLGSWNGWLFYVNRPTQLPSAKGFARLFLFLGNRALNSWEPPR